LRRARRPHRRQPHAQRRGHPPRRRAADDPAMSTADVAVPTPGMSQDLARSQGTDFFAMDDLLSAEERAIRDRVRAFVDEQVIPVANDYWERAEFPHELV